MPDPSQEEGYSFAKPKALQDKIREHADAEMRSIAKQMILILSAHYGRK